MNERGQSVECYRQWKSEVLLEKPRRIACFRTNPTMTVLELNPELGDERPVTNCLSHGKFSSQTYLSFAVSTVDISCACFSKLPDHAIEPYGVDLVKHFVIRKLSSSPSPFSD